MTGEPMRVFAAVTYHPSTIPPDSIQKSEILRFAIVQMNSLIMFSSISCRPLSVATSPLGRM